MFSENFMESDLDKCKSLYFDPKNVAMYQMIQSTKGIFDLDVLKSWADAFNSFQISIGIFKKTPQDYNRHFFMWLNKQNLSLDPKKINDVSGNSKASGFIPRPNSKEANDNRKNESDDQISRLFSS